MAPYCWCCCSLLLGQNTDLGAVVGPKGHPAAAAVGSNRLPLVTQCTHHLLHCAALQFMALVRHLQAQAPAQLADTCKRSDTATGVLAARTCFQCIARWMQGTMPSSAQAAGARWVQLPSAANPHHLVGGLDIIVAVPA